MFKLFKKREPATPEEKVLESQKKQDWKGLAEAYYELGRTAMEQGESDKARLWLHRADTVCSARDDVYEAVGEQLMDDCSDRIGQLEEGTSLYNDVPAQVEEKAEGLGNAKTRVWGLLALARLVKLGERLSGLPGCGCLGKLGWAVDTVLKSFQSPPDREELDGLKDLSGELYDLSDAPSFWGMGSEVPSTAGGAPFQVFDLNGMLALLEVEAYLVGHLKMILAISQGEEPPEPETGVIGCTLVPDYYVRTGAARLEEVPQVKAELERVWSDYDFICSTPSWETMAERIAAYKELDILA